MRDINRIERICHDLERLWKQNPDQRLGQLLENYVFPRVIASVHGVSTGVVYCWSQEDDETNKKIIMNTDFQHHSTDCNNLASHGEKKNE
jgi:hypothetical protein